MESWMDPKGVPKIIPMKILRKPEYTSLSSEFAFIPFNSLSEVNYYGLFWTVCPSALSEWICLRFNAHVIGKN